MYSLPAMDLSIIKRHKAHSALVLAILFAAILEVLGFQGVLPLVIMISVAYLAISYVTPWLARRIARVAVSIRWKIVAVLGLMGVLFVSVAVINFEAMDYMHTELHAILDLQQSDPQGVIAAVEDLEQTQHGFFFSFAPLLALLGALMAMALGAGIAISVIEPVRRMGQAMRRIAEGDFSEPVEVDNRDELGELAARINHTAAELERLQADTLADERSKALRERIVQVTAAEEEERRRISRELHDGLGPSLAVVVNRLRSCQQMVRTNPAAAEHELEDVTRSLKAHIQDIRDLINGLRPLTIDQLGLVGAIRQHVERFASETGTPVLSLLAPQVSLDPLGEVTVFRIFQECMSNVQRHSRARHLEVHLHDTTDGVELIVEDDGDGFEALGARAMKSDAGVGLASMHERAKLVGGVLQVRSSPGRGCRVTLLIPAREVGETRTEVAVGQHSSTAG